MPVANPMHDRRFLVRELSTEPEVRIRGEEAHHLLQVLRLRPGDDVVVFDGSGEQYRAVLIRCEAKEATARKLEALPFAESPLELTMAVAIPKGDKMSLIVQKLTELGASRIIPLRCKRTHPSSTATSAVSKKLSRWQRVALEACKQSGRLRVPKIEAPIGFQEFLALELPPHRLLTCLDGKRLPGTPPSPRACVAAVGPEGGWTDEETSTALTGGFLTFGMGPSVLRTETAAIAAATILQWEWGDLENRTEQTSSS